MVPWGKKLQEIVHGPQELKIIMRITYTHTHTPQNLFGNERIYKLINFFVHKIHSKGTGGRKERWGEGVCEAVL